MNKVITSLFVVCCLAIVACNSKHKPNHDLIVDTHKIIDNNNAAIKNNEDVLEKMRSRMEDAHKKMDMDAKKDMHDKKAGMSMGADSSSNMHMMRGAKMVEDHKALLARHEEVLKKHGDLESRHQDNKVDEAAALTENTDLEKQSKEIKAESDKLLQDGEAAEKAMTARMEAHNAMSPAAKK